MLSRDERDYLFRIAGEAPLQTAGPNREVGHAVRYLPDALTEVPAYVVDAQYDVLAWNALAVHFIGDMSAAAEDHRNMIRWIFRRPGTDAVWNDADSVRFVRDTVADLRAAYARYRGDPGLGRLVTEMLGVSPLFAEMWAPHEVAERRRIVYCPPPDSPTQATFQRLATQTAGTGPAHSP